MGKYKNENSEKKQMQSSSDEEKLSQKKTNTHIDTD